MDFKKDFFQLIELPTSINLSNEILYKNTDSVISSSDKIPLDSYYIDYYKYRKREKDEFWKSIDIYIKTEKNDDILNILSEFLTKNKPLESNGFKKFNNMENNENLFDFYSSDSESIDLIKLDDRLVIRITKFES